MGRYRKEHNDFFNAIKDIEKDVGRAVKDPSIRTVVRAAKIINKPSKFPRAIIAYEIMKSASENISEDINPIPSYRIKRKILVKQSEFDNWIEKHRINTNKSSQIVEEILNDFDIRYNM